MYFVVFFPSVFTRVSILERTFFIYKQCEIIDMWSWSGQAVRENREGDQHGSQRKGTE